MNTVRLGDLCDFVPAQVSPVDMPRTIYLGLEHLAPGRLVAVGHGNAQDVLSSKSRFQRGDVLYGKLRPYLDKAVLAERDGVCTTELLVLRPREGVNGRYLAAVIHSPEFTRHAVSGTTGAHHPRTSWHHIREFELPDFDSDTRNRFAAFVWAVHDSLLRSELQLTSAERLKQAAMQELFSRGLRGESGKTTDYGEVPESWAPARLSEVAHVQTGAAKGRKFADAEVVDVPYLRVANVQDGHLDLSEMKTLRIRRTEVERYRLQNGDVVLTEGGDFDKLGRGFMWRAEIPLCIHQNHVFAVRTNRAVLDPEFFAYLAQSSYGKSYFRHVAHKTTNLACINSNKLKAFPVVLPTLEEQREICSILSALDHRIDIQKQKRVILDRLFKSLLHNLTTGVTSVSDLDVSSFLGATSQVSA